METDAEAEALPVDFVGKGDDGTAARPLIWQTACSGCHSAYSPEIDLIPTLTVAMAPIYPETCFNGGYPAK